MTKSILLVGVGGQGTILASKILTVGLMKAGFDIKMSEIHGMSQRGGSVSSHVRYGDRVHSPVIEEGGADILVAFEKMEGLRWMTHLKPSGKAIINDYQIDSMPILTGDFSYPKNVVQMIGEAVDTTVVDAAAQAELLGNSKVMNIILLGALVKRMELENIDWHQIIKENVKPKFYALNLKAFEVGIGMVCV
ncbi:MAG: indolepyruvate oxidoreductase subunit beta [Firmicutes bacterium]|nr:indolepyruvate oxidoreductase subunit beta [Bacillota bacterium]